MSALKAHQKIALILFVIIELVGVYGLLSGEWHDYFVALTSVNLLFVAGVLLVFHQDFYKTETLWMVVVVLVGYFVEVIGVKTGMLFGEYQYGAGLGPKVLEVPPIMGINWLLLCYTSTKLAAKMPFHFLLQAAIASTIMVGLDFFMEPVAMVFDFWNWEGGEIPFRNYLAWWLISFLLNAIWLRIDQKAQNNFSHWVFLYLLVFFVTMNLVFTSGIH